MSTPNQDQKEEHEEDVHSAKPNPLPASIELFQALQNLPSDAAAAQQQFHALFQDNQPIFGDNVNWCALLEELSNLPSPVTVANRDNFSLSNWEPQFPLESPTTYFRNLEAPQHNNVHAPIIAVGPVSTPQQSFPEKDITLETAQPLINNPFLPLLSLCEGFLTTPAEEIASGRGNKIAAPRQVVQINIPATKGLEVLAKPLPFKVVVSLLKFDRVHNKKSDLVDRLAEAFVVHEPHLSRYAATFDDIVLQETSFNNGGKLYLRFSLLDGKNNFISSVDSAEFQTITKKGKLKRKHKQQGSVDCVNPNLGPSSGGQLVKIFGQGFFNSPSGHSKVVVKFGDKNAREVHSIKRNVIICETPEGEGTVKVSVSFDGGASWLESCSYYKYVNPAVPEDMASWNQLVNPSISVNMVYASNNSIDCYFAQEDSTQRRQAAAHTNFNGFNIRNISTASLWFLEGLLHPCKFTPLHCCAAYGYLEFGQVYLQALKSIGRLPSSYVNAKDNYGRTPLMWAVAYGQWEMAGFLIQNGADITTTEEHGHNILFVGLSECDDYNGLADFIDGLVQLSENPREAENCITPAIEYAYEHESDDPHTSEMFGRLKVC